MRAAYNSSSDRNLTCLTYEVLENLMAPFNPEVLCTDTPTQPAKSQRHPGRPAAQRVENDAPSADVAELKRQWSEGMDDSFKRWVEFTPDEVFLRWVNSVHEQQMVESWRTAVTTVLSLRGGKASYHEKIALNELLGCPEYQKLSDIDQRSARWIIDNQDAEFKAKR